MTNPLRAQFFDGFFNVTGRACFGRMNGNMQALLFGPPKNIDKFSDRIIDFIPRQIYTNNTFILSGYGYLSQPAGILWFMPAQLHNQADLNSVICLGLVGS